MTIRLICASHTPLMDHVDADPAVDQAVREVFARQADVVTRFDPELIVLFAPDHFKGFFYEMMPPFTVGIRATAIGDYGIGSGAFTVPETLALDCVDAIRAAEVDVALSYRMEADHGFAQLLVLLAGTVDRFPVLPIHINCAGPPLPSFRRVRKLGEAVGAWANALDKRVLILGSGGLSHDPPIPRIKDAPPLIAERLIAGRNPPMEERLAREQANFETARKLARGEGVALPLNPQWDLDFMAQMAGQDFGTIEASSDDELTLSAGCGGHEVRTWIAAHAAMRAAGSYTSQQLFYRDIPQWNAGMGIVSAQLTKAPI